MRLPIAEPEDENVEQRRDDRRPDHLVDDLEAAHHLALDQRPERDAINHEPSSRKTSCSDEPAGEQLLGRLFGDDPSAANDRDPPAELFGFFQVMRREKNRQPLGVELRAANPTARCAARRRRPPSARRESADAARGSAPAPATDGASGRPKASCTRGASAKSGRNVRAARRRVPPRSFRSARSSPRSRSARRAARGSGRSCTLAGESPMSRRACRHSRSLS